MPGIGIITNPHSKLNKGNSQRKKLLSYILGEQGKQKITKDLSELTDSVHYFCQQNIELLAINGGDGTISCTLTALIHAYQDKPLPKILILPGGTINTLAQNLSIRGTPEEILYQAINKYSSTGKLACRNLPSLKVNNHYGFIFASGTCAHFLQVFYKNKTNALGSLLLLAKIILSRLTSNHLYNQVVRSQYYELSVEQQGTIKHQSCSVLCSSIKNLPLGIPYFRNIPADQSAFELSSIITPARSLPWRLPSLLIKKKTHDKVNLTCKNITMQSDYEINYTLDGELYSTNEPITTEIGKTIEFLII